MRRLAPVFGSIGIVIACSGNSSNVPPPAGQTGTSCTAASSCYPGMDAGALHGQVTCLTQLTNGYCTHTCQADGDCCAVPGECPSSLKEVCASFESSSGLKYCFLSCNAADIAADPNAGDPSTFCQRWVAANASCRSTGGGSANQKFCAL